MSSVATVIERCHSYKLPLMAASGASPELMKQLWDALGVHIASRLKQGKSVVIPQFCRFALNDDGRVSFHLYEGFRSRHGVNERQVPTAKQKPPVDIMYLDIARHCSTTKEVAKSLLTEMFDKIGSLSGSEGKSLRLTLPGVGSIDISGRTFRFIPSGRKTQLSRPTLVQNSARILNTQPVPNKAEVPEVLSPISSRSMSRPQLYGGLHAAPGANALSSGGRKSSDRRSHRSARSQAPGARSMPSLTVAPLQPPQRRELSFPKPITAGEMDAYNKDMRIEKAKEAERAHKQMIAEEKAQLRKLRREVRDQQRKALESAQRRAKFAQQQQDLAADRLAATHKEVEDDRAVPHDVRPWMFSDNEELRKTKKARQHAIRQELDDYMRQTGKDFSAPDKTYKPSEKYPYFLSKHPVEEPRAHQPSKVATQIVQQEAYQRRRNQILQEREAALKKNKEVEAYQEKKRREEHRRLKEKRRRQKEQYKWIEMRRKSLQERTLQERTMQLSEQPPDPRNIYPVEPDVDPLLVRKAQDRLRQQLDQQLEEKAKMRQSQRELEKKEREMLMDAAYKQMSEDREFRARKRLEENKAMFGEWDKQKELKQMEKQLAVPV